MARIPYFCSIGLPNEMYHLKNRHTMKIKLSGLCLLLLLNVLDLKGQSPADQVDMRMGTYGAGHCVVGPQLPHGSINPSPQTANGGHGGYVTGQPIRGFGQLHVSGTGWSRYGQILLSPQTGFNPEETGHDSPLSDEEARPDWTDTASRPSWRPPITAPSTASASRRRTRATYCWTLPTTYRSTSYPKSGDVFMAEK